MKPPMLRSRDQDGTRKPRSLQEKQGGDGKRPERVKNPGTRSLTRQEGRDRDRADQREHKAVGLKTAEKLGRHG